MSLRDKIERNRKPRQDPFFEGVSAFLEGEEPINPYPPEDSSHSDRQQWYNGYYEARTDSFLKDMETKYPERNWHGEEQNRIQQAYIQ